MCTGTPNQTQTPFDGVANHNCCIDGECARAAAMSVYMNDGLLDEVVSHLLQRLKEGQRTIKPDVLRSYVAAVGHVRWVVLRVDVSCLDVVLGWHAEEVAMCCLWAMWGGEC
eukprot:1138678-Pelagomonas_calceolata.AAC.12